jgi:hypothetical protein
MALPCRQLTVTGSTLAVLGGERAVLGGLRPELRGVLALRGGTHQKLYARQRACVLVLRRRGVELCHRLVTRGSGLVTREGSEISEFRDLVPPLGDTQAPCRGLITFAGGALPDITAEFVRSSGHAGQEIVIAGGLVAIGGKLVALRACLISVCGCLIGV